MELRHSGERAPWSAAAVAAAIALTLPAAAGAQAPTNKPEPKETTPRSWLVVTGGLIFTIGYAWAAGTAAFGEPTRFDNKEFGSPGLFYVPILGPILFDANFCADASDHYRDVEPNNAIDRQEYCGNIMALFMTLPQVIGASMFASGFVFPQELPMKAANAGGFSVLPTSSPGQLRVDLRGTF
ncbi:MAG TPA: hypothetical protein PKA88_39490 [Polyangiaceae bacterium]|nr:hypothetical protein [Polyangiaceae bacterium]